MICDHRWIILALALLSLFCLATAHEVMQQPESYEPPDCYIQPDYTLIEDSPDFDIIEVFAGITAGIFVFLLIYCDPGKKRKHEKDPQKEDNTGGGPDDS